MAISKVRYHRRFAGRNYHSIREAQKFKLLDKDDGANLSGFNMEIRVPWIVQKL